MVNNISEGKCVDGKCFAIPDKTEGSGSTTLNIVYNTNKTGKICTARFRIRSKDGFITREYLLAQDASPIFYNIKMVQPFTKNDCLANEHGTVVLYEVPAFKYSSLVSQNDADAMAMEDIARNGQNFANDNGRCVTDIWYSSEMGEDFTRNNCDKFSNGGVFRYVVPAGRYVSSLSQEDADRKAREDIDKNGQNAANVEGVCTPRSDVFKGVYNKEFTRNNCDSTQYGTKIVVDETMVSGDFRSTESQSAANELAKVAVESQGQDIANIKGACEKVPVYTGTYSKSFTRSNCPQGGVPGSYVVTDRMMDGYPYTSTVSQADANQKAMAAVNAGGQALANNMATCTFTGVSSMSFIKNDCDPGYQGSQVTVTQADVTGGPFTSNESQAAANSIALSAVQQQGQAIANTRGTCTERDYYIGIASFEFTRNNCGANKRGVPMDINQDMVEGAPFRSYNSQAEANSLAMAAVMAQGQGVVNTLGQCVDSTRYQGMFSMVFVKDNCPPLLVPSRVTVTETDVTGGPFYSYESQYAADQMAKDAVLAQGQALANSRGTCDEKTIYIGSYSRSFVPVCPACHYSDSVILTPDIMGQMFTSSESQEEADLLAKTYVDRLGQAFANKNYGHMCHTIVEQPEWETVGTVCKDCISQFRQRNTNECYEGAQERHIPGGSATCYWFGLATQSFVKQCADGGSGSTVVVNQDMVTDPNLAPEGRFKSCVSQADANSKAASAVQSQGQSVANNLGTCTWIGQYSGNVQKNNCADGGVGSQVMVNSNSLASYPNGYKSNVSLADANSKAMAVVKGAEGQAYANKNGDCTWTYVATRTFYRNNCGTGVGQAIQVNSTQANGGTVITSMVSLADAQNKANLILDSNGQSYANSNGVCVYTGNSSAGFTRNNCGSCKHGIALAVSYSSLGLPAITSTISQADANSKAQTAMNSDPTTRNAAQAYANKNGDCADDDKTPSYTQWENYCDGCNYRRRRSQTNPCAIEGNQDELVEADSCQCGSSCCCDPNYYPTSTYACNGGVSQRLYTSECYGNQWRNEGLACPNTNSFASGKICKTKCLCGGPCFNYSGVSAGSINRATTEAANTEASNVFNSGVSNATSQANSAACNPTYSNTAFVITKSRNNCPAGTSGSTYNHSVPAGKYKDHCSQSEADLVAREVEDELAQAAANTNGNCIYPVHASARTIANPCKGNPSNTLVGRIDFILTYRNTCPSGHHYLTVKLLGANAGGTVTAQGEFEIPKGEGTITYELLIPDNVYCNSVTVEGEKNTIC